VLPETQNVPSSRTQSLVGVAIPRGVGRELGLPPRAIRARDRAMLGATVPEAPVYEDDQSVAGERDIRASASSGRKGSVDPKA